MDKIINILLLIIIFVFDPLAIALVIAANFAFTQLRPKKEYPLEEQVDDMRKVVDAYDTLKDEIEDNEGSDIYTKEDFSDWDSTLMDGLKEEEWKEQPKGVPVYFDPETKRPYVIEENEEDEELEDKDLVKPEIEVKMSGEPSLNMLSEEEKQYDLNNDGILDNQEQARLRDDKLLNTQGISSWRRKKIQDYLDGKTKRYF
jgi:hypothetical protein